MGNNISAKHTCISDYLMDPESPLEEWRPLFKMASMGFAEIVMESGEMSIWATQQQMNAFMEIDGDDTVGDDDIIFPGYE